MNGTTGSPAGGVIISLIAGAIGSGIWVADGSVLLACRRALAVSVVAVGSVAVFLTGLAIGVAQARGLG